MPQGKCGIYSTPSELIEVKRPKKVPGRQYYPVTLVSVVESPSQIALFCAEDLEPLGRVIEPW